MLSKAYYISLDGRGRDSTPSCTWTLQWLMNCSSNGKRGNEQSQYRERKRGRAKKSQYASVEFTSLGLTHKYVQISLIYLTNFEGTERERRKEREKEKEWQKRQCCELKKALPPSCYCIRRTLFVFASRTAQGNLQCFDLLWRGTGMESYGIHVAWGPLPLHLIANNYRSELSHSTSRKRACVGESKLTLRIRNART